MTSSVYFAALISRENRPIHIEALQNSKGLNEIISNKIDKSPSIPSTISLNPLAGKVDGGDLISDKLKYHFLSNMALDVFLSPFYEGETGTEQLLFSQDGINVYGYETNTGLKILIGSSDKIDQSFRKIFEKLHRTYLGLVLNPFQNNENLSNIAVNEKKLSEKIVKIFDDLKKETTTTEPMTKSV